MTKLTRFIATCILVVSTSVIALADGGATQGPGLAPPAPPTECTSGRPVTDAFAPEPNSSDDIVSKMTKFGAWLASIF